MVDILKPKLSAEAGGALRKNPITNVVIRKRLMVASSLIYGGYKARLPWNIYREGYLKNE